MRLLRYIHVAYGVHLHDLDGQAVKCGAKPAKLAGDELVIVDVGPQAVGPRRLQRHPTLLPWLIHFWDVVIDPRLVHHVRDLVAALAKMQSQALFAVLVYEERKRNNESYGYGKGSSICC